MMRVIQISDTHLSPDKRHFGDNWEPVAQWIAARQPDLVIHTGDVTVDGAGVEEDARYCGELLRGLNVPVLAVPGNHDVGDAGDPHQSINSERLARWRRHFGDDYWARDVEEWRLVGLNALLLGSDEPAEQQQMEWLQDTLHDAHGRGIALFLHRPLFLDAPHEPDKGYWAVKPPQRRVLLDLVRRHGVTLVASGHLHRWHDATRDGTRFIWGPSSAFLVGPTMAPQMPGERWLGAAQYTFDGARATVEFVPIDGLKTYWIDDVVHDVYPNA